MMLQVADHDFCRALPVKWMHASECVVVEATQGIHVSALIQRCALELLGSHEEDRTEDGISVFYRLQGW